MASPRKMRGMALLIVVCPFVFFLVALGGCSSPVIPQNSVCPIPAAISKEDQAQILALLNDHPNDFIGRLIVAYASLRSQARKCLAAARP